MERVCPYDEITPNSLIHNFVSLFSMCYNIGTVEITQGGTYAVLKDTDRCVFHNEAGLALEEDRSDRINRCLVESHSSD